MSNSAAISCVLILELVFVVRDVVVAKTYKANIVEAPSNYGFQQQQQQLQQFGASSGLAPLTLKRHPAPFFGSEALRPLSRKCFALDKNNYEWKLCPFQNATQTETGTSRWNPYRGVLGIWSNWRVDAVGNALSSMSMTDGDDCGTHGPRKVDVKPVCGPKESLASVEEPSTCHYAMTLEAPLFCQSNNLLVYPYLTEPARIAWDEAFTEWKNGILTTKGYVRAVLAILSDVGVVASLSNASVDSRSTTAISAAAAAAAAGETAERDSSKSDCGDEYKEVVGKYERLAREHAETILEIGKCRRDLRRVMGADRAEASNSAAP